MASTAGSVMAGKLRAIAVVNHTRLENYPNIPTMAQVGYPDVGTIAWQGVFAPANTPKPVVKKLFNVITQVLKSPAVKAKFAKQNFNIVPNKSLADANT